MQKIQVYVDSNEVICYDNFIDEVVLARVAINGNN